MLRGAYTAPRPLRRRNWFVADGRQYKPFAKSPDRHYRGAWLSITSLTIGSRLCVPLRGHGFAEFAAHAGTQERPEIRIDIGERVVIRVARHVVPEKRERGLHAGLDKGHDTLLTLSFGDPEEPRSYGVGVGSKVSERTVTAEDALRHRRRLAAYERSLRNSVPEKARRIRRANLRRIKRSRSSARTACGFRDLINGGLNAMFRQQPELAVLHVESLHFGHSDRGRAFNRRLRRWMKGFLQERLRYKAELNGVELNVVNAAYTSQTCPRCGFTSSKNRHAAKFKCGLCGYAGSADAVAATNILRRGSDTAVTRFMPSGEVKQILEERWRAALNGGAWGSNGVALGTDVTEITAAAGAANNCVRSPSVLGSNEQSTWTGLEHNHLRAARTCEPVPRGPVE
jgi:ribosomal protein S27AE